MAIKRSFEVINAQQDTFESVVGPNPILRIRTGPPPPQCESARTGTILISINLPSDWLTPASGGIKYKSGTWLGTTSNSGVAGHYEIVDSTGTVCHEQGTAGVSTTKLTHAFCSGKRNVLVFSDPIGISIGMNVENPNIPLNTVVEDIEELIDGTFHIFLSRKLIADIPGGEEILFRHDLYLLNDVFTVGQPRSISTYSTRGLL